MQIEREAGPEIILASRSPRRQELLRKIVTRFRVVPSQVDEENFWEQDPVRFAIHAAEAKARDVAEKFPRALVLGADTLVCLGKEILGKPKDRLDARQMIKKLSGQRHRVITAVALYKKDEDRLLSDYEISHVRFKPLTDEEIESYLAAGEFADKAGSYAIQKVGDAFVEKLEGDYDNVVGLPVKRVKRLLAEFLSQEHSATITDIAFPNDWGVATIDKAVTFVPGTIVGDKVRIRIVRKKKKHFFGRVINFTSRSPFRVEPECPHFGECGGCAFQNLAYSKQLELKENYLLRTLKRIGKIEATGLEKEPIIPSPDIYFYRNKMEFAFGGEGRRVFLGLRQRTSPLAKGERSTVELKKCPIFSPAFEEIFPFVASFANETGLPAYDPDRREGYFRNLVLREGKASGDILAILVTKSGRKPEVWRLAETLERRFSLLKSFWWVETDRVSDVVDFSAKKLISGKKFIEDSMGGFRFRIYPESFFQPNPRAAEILYSKIAAEAKARGSRKVLGLYCGPGSIEIFLSRTVDEVVGVDSEPTNITTAVENCRANGIPNCRFIEGRVELVLKKDDFRSFDLVVLDPPRAGISAKGLKHIISLNIPAIFYVSCNPAALARDLSLFAQQGYRLQKLSIFDFFPHTPHLESLAIIARD
ncbi:MAG: 23S rRNA (uracil(1939)-C(5))-methyltransferase RlmD [Clostridiales bacterium]|nr:23S rRNA (uracil(1939)-C(5))-methyltransferase RlmD [Clostridiales bacterium]